MKKTIYVLGLMSAFLAASCTNLDEEVFSSITKDRFFSSEEQLVVYCARAYSGMQAYATEQSLWTLNIQLTNEMCTPVNPNGSWTETRYAELQKHDIDSGNKLVRCGWDFCFDGIASCNDVIYEIENSKMSFAGKDKVLAEMKVLRAFFYLCAIDGWGNVPFSINKTDPGYPEQKDRKTVADFIEKEIKENIDLLAKAPTSEYYGRVTRAMANATLAKLYLNWDVWFGTPRWKDAEDACADIVNSGEYFIVDDYKDNFKVYNEYCPEGIMALPYSNVYTQSDHNAFIIYMLTLAPEQASAWNIPGVPWDGFVCQPDFFDSYEEGDLRKSRTWIYGQQKNAEGKDIEGYVIDGYMPEEAYTEKRTANQGARLGKWDYQMDGTLQGGQTSMDNDFYIIRYADVVLMYVEAMLRQGEKRISDAVNVADFQKIRTRAGLEPFTADNLTLENLYWERAHELAAEGWLRQDMIRFGKYLEEWWNKPETPETDLLLPIPKERMATNPNLKQNPGY